MIVQSKSLLDSIKKDRKAKSDNEMLKIEIERISKENADMN